MKPTAITRRTFFTMTLRELSDATGQDKNSVLVDYDVFVKASELDRSNPTKLYRAEDFDFRLRPGSNAVDRGMRLPGVNDGFTGRAPDLGAYETGQPCRITARESRIVVRVGDGFAWSHS